MSDELKRLAKYIKELPPVRKDGGYWFGAHSFGVIKNLCSLVLADLASREREAAERALPVTADWFYGLDRSHGYLVIEWSEFCGLYARYGDDKVFLNMNPTRGNVLDLLSALGAGKGGA